MRMVNCEECGKHYDFDLDDFCPRCGAFNYPSAESDGMVVRVDGINESNHEGSFLHEELHRENRQRNARELPKSVEASFRGSRKPILNQSASKTESGKDPTTRMIKKATAASRAAVIVIIMLFFLFNLLGRLIFLL